MELQGFKPPELFTSAAPKCTYFPYDEASSSTSRKSPSQKNRVNSVEAETSLLRAVFHDSKTGLASQTKRLSDFLFDRAATTKLLHLCCDFDSAANLAGEIIGSSSVVPLVNECDSYGKAPLHTAASAHAPMFVEVLLKKHARTDLRTKDAQSQLPLELSLADTRIMDPKCDINEISIEELAILISRKDLRTVKLLSENSKTKEVADVAHTCAVKGRVASLAALLLVAAEKVVNECALAVRDSSSGTEEKVSLYEWLIRKALALGASAKRASSSVAEAEERRKVLLREIELLQLFGAVAVSRGGDKKVTSSISPLIRAAQVGDEDVIRLLLQTKIDVNDTDAEGNSALHCVLKLSKLMCPQQIKIILLLLDHGARVSQKNRLGLTAFHVAAGNGDSEALEVLLLEDPFGVQYKTEMKETPLFFAVKNESKECAELLLTWGANTEVLNLRRQRAIDLATSQDMRYILLNPATVSLINHAFPNQHKRTVLELSDEDSSTTTESSHVSTACARNSNPSTKSEVSKYFDSHRGCVRGSKCFYAHCEEESQKVKKGVDPSYSFTAKLLKHKVFVGGLPPSVDTDVLQTFCEEEFGSVEDAIVIVTQVEDKIQSRGFGFGFVTFRQEKSALKAIEAHYVALMGKTVEIKSLIPRLVFGAEFDKKSPQGEREQVFQVLEQKSYENVMESDKPEKGSWADRLVHGIPMVCSAEPRVTKRSEDPSTPKWLKIFKKWFPGFLKGLSNHPKYALSSLKADFRDKFGLELDHSSVGYSKLSDFLKCFSNICTVQMLPIGTGRVNTHMIIRPKLTRPKCRLPKCRLLHSLETPKSMSLSTLIVNGGDSNCFSNLSTSDGGDSKGRQDLSIDNGGDLKCLESPTIDSCSDTKSLQDLTAANAVDSKCCEDLSLDFGGDSKCIEDLSIWSTGKKVGSSVTSHGEENPSSGNGEIDSAEDVNGVHPRFLQFLKPDPLFYSQEQTDVLSGDKGSTNVRDPRQHLVLESLSKKWSKSYFLRQFDYYEKYKERLSARRCFACNQRQMIWANFPCKHLLWCNDCKSRAISAAGLFPHKCVMCDTEVLKMEFVLPLASH